MQHHHAGHAAFGHVDRRHHPAAGVPDLDRVAGPDAQPLGVRGVDRGFLGSDHPDTLAIPALMGRGQSPPCQRRMS